MANFKVIGVLAITLSLIAFTLLQKDTAQAQIPVNNLKVDEEKLTCIGRSTIISRAQAWVDQKVPYSQTGTHDGYRTDCSGYVSMAWELAKPGLTTFTLHTVSTNITKDSLQAGDAILCDSEHVVIFGAWTDSGKTHYTSYEQMNTQYGTVKETTPYPYWSNQGCYHAVRFNNVC